MALTCNINKNQTVLSSRQFRMACITVIVAWFTLTSAAQTTHAQSDISSGDEERHNNAITTTQGPVELTLELSKTQLLVAEPVRWTVQARAPRGIDLQLVRDDTSWEPFTLLKQSQHPAIPEAQNRLWVWNFEMDTLKTGELQTPKLKLTWRDNREDKKDVNPFGELYLPQQFVNVSSVLESNADPLVIRDFKPPLTLPEPKQNFPWLTVSWIAAGSIAGMALAMTAVVLLRRSRPSAWTILQQRLDEIEAQIETADDATRVAAWIETVDAFRHYLEGRCDIRAMQMTDSELITAVEKHRLLDVTVSEYLRESMGFTEAVKFAGFIPEVDQVRESLHAVRAMVSDIEVSFKQKQDQGSIEEAVEVQRSSDK